MSRPKVIGADSSDLSAILADQQRRQIEADQRAREEARMQEQLRIEQDRLEREQIAAAEQEKIIAAKTAEKESIGEVNAQNDAVDPNKVDLDFFNALYQGVNKPQ